MSEASDSNETSQPNDEESGISQKRLWSLTAAVVIISVLGSLAFENQKITIGVALGGLLSLLNFYWLKTSTAAMLEQAAEGAKPNVAARFFLRYIIIGFVVFFSYLSNLVSVVAVLCGLLAFTAAVFIESFFQLFIAIVKREDI